MRLWSDSFVDGALLAPEFAFAAIDPARHVRLAANRNPHLAWDDVPNGTQSLILFCHDIDAPSAHADANQVGRVIARELPREDFYHWILADIPVTMPAIQAGAFSQGVTARGKSGPAAPVTIKNGSEHALRQGVNDYTRWFANDPDMAGDYYGYDGPCPPWNDLRPHTYLFTLYALEVPRLGLDGRFTGLDARRAIHDHILDEARVFCVYALNPSVAAAL
jgi:Raf kinase inhibitor-like YbhB/YbcL family protein